MKNAIPLLAACTIVAACTNPPYQDPAERVTSASRPAEPPRARPESRGAETDKVFSMTAMVCTRSPCRVEIVAKEDGCRSTPDIVFIKPAEHDLRIEWRVAREADGRLVARPFEWAPSSRQQAAGHFQPDPGVAADGSFGITARAATPGVFRYQLTVERKGWSCKVEAPIIAED